MAGVGSFYVPNDYVLSLARKHPEFLPAISIHPARPDAIEELNRCLDAGAVMMKCLPNCQNFNCSDKRFTKFWERMAELGAMAHSAAEVRVFSDDGKCVHDAVIMRRALEYVKAFDGVVAQHAQEPRLTEHAQMNEGELSGRLGLVGWPAVAEEAVP